MSLQASIPETQYYGNIHKETNMVEKLLFEYCKSDDSSKLIDLELRGNKYLLKIASGRNGIYLDSSFSYYECETKHLEYLLEQLQKLNIYGWKRYYPISYKPSNRLMGSDSGTWSLHYKETEKKIFRHVNGYREYPPKWSQFILYLNTLIPCTKT